MTRDDGPAFKQTLAAVYGFYGKDLSASALSIWFAALKSYDLATVADALSRHCVNPDSGQFLPKPADVVRLIDGGSSDAALVAWSKVDRALRTVGPYATVVFDDPLIHYALGNMGGWVHLGQADEKEWPFIRNQFVTLYRGARGRQFEYPAKLLGIAEAGNGHQGQPVGAPILIGDQERARSILQRGSKAPALEARPFRDIALPHHQDAA